MQLITVVTIKIDEAVYTDRSQLVDILKDYQSTKTGSSYKVTGSYQVIEDLFMKLCTMRHRDSSNNRATMHECLSNFPKASHVATPVMEYIKKRHSEELNRIKGDHVHTEEQPSAKTENITLIFKPRNSHVEVAHVHLVRERFVTFYQKIASNLHVKNVSSINPHHCKDLQNKFLELLIEPQQVGARVSGPYEHIVSLEDFLRQNSSSSRHGRTRSRMDEAPMDGVNNQSHSSSTANCERSDEEELCAICMEGISKAVKQTLGCTHSFCRDCLKRAFDYKPVCPICGVLYGTLKGTQPEEGTMSWTNQPSSLPGYESYGTITVHYFIPSGIQKVGIYCILMAVQSLLV